MSGTSKNDVEEAIKNASPEQREKFLKSLDALMNSRDGDEDTTFMRQDELEREKD